MLRQFTGPKLTERNIRIVTANVKLWLPKKHILTAVEIYVLAVHYVVIVLLSDKSAVCQMCDVLVRVFFN